MRRSRLNEIVNISKIKTPTIQSDRLILRPLRPDDADAMHIAMSDAPLMTYWSSGPHKNVQETRDYITVNATEAQYRTWAITLKEDGTIDEKLKDEALGWVVLLDRRQSVKEIGYILRASHHGRGIAREAVHAIIQYGFDILDLRKIIADTDPDNIASNRVLTDMGFQKEGYMREEWETHLGVRDSLLWGLLRSDYNRG